MADRPLLTIAIPTFNRAPLLARTLQQIQKERATLDALELEILVCDNASPDGTATLLHELSRYGPPLRIVTQPENIGADRNMAACFNLARGRYLWILGDDDIPTDGTIAWLLERLRNSSYGLVYVRPFGYDHDFVEEFPGGAVRDVEIASREDFLAKVGAHLTFISSIVVSKEMLPDIDADLFCGSALVQVEIYLSALLRAHRFLYSDGYRVACKRNNSGGYEFSEVFVERLGRITDRYRGLGLSAEAQNRLEHAMVVGYFAQNILRVYLRGTPSPAAHRRFRTRFRHDPAYWILIEPLFVLPRVLAIAWAYLATAIGRTLSGDLRRGLTFFLYQTISRAKRASHG